MKATELYSPEVGWVGEIKCNDPYRESMLFVNKSVHNKIIINTVIVEMRCLQPDKYFKESHRISI